MNDLTWDTTFRELFERRSKLHTGGDTRAVSWFTEADKTFLDDIGYTTQEFFDFVDDHCRYGAEGPTLETSLLVAAVRRDFFRVVQQGVRSEKTVPPSALPPKPAAVADMADSARNTPPNATANFVFGGRFMRKPQPFDFSRTK